VPLLIAAEGVLWTTGPIGRRLAIALRRNLVPFSAVAALLVVRTWALGGVGGHAGALLEAGWLDLPATIWSHSSTLLLPQPLFDSAALNRGLVAAFAVGLAAVLCASSWSDAGRASRGAHGDAGVAALAAFWILALASITAASGRAEPWYSVPFLAPYGLLLGLVIEVALQTSGRAGRRVSIAAAILSVGLLGSHLRFSPVIYRYPEWPRLSERQHEFLADLRGQVEELGPNLGTVVRGLPEWQDPAGPVGVRGASGLAVYSVQAYADLLDAGFPIRVSESSGTRVPIPEEGTLQIDVVVDGEPHSGGE
jgi:hypothetical protein